MTPRRNPSPSPSPQDPPSSRPAEEEAASSTASSAASNGAGAFFADAGPAFDADSAADQAPPVADEVPSELAWGPETVEGLLVAQGQVMHTAIGKAEQDWVYTRDELRAIAPPLTRILNRYDATRAAAASGDELALLIGLTGYVGRSVGERRRALAELRADEEEVRGGPVFDGATMPADFDPPAPAEDAEIIDTPPIGGRRR